MRMAAFFILVGSSILYGGPNGKPMEYPIKVAILDFVFNKYDALRFTELDLIEDPSIMHVSPTGVISPHMIFKTGRTGVHQSFRYRMSAEGTDGFVEARPAPASVLHSVQRRALETMLEEGYLTQALYDIAMGGVGLWEPRQVRFAFSYSELTLREARILFDGDVPWNRVLLDEIEKPKDPAERERFDKRWDNASRTEWESIFLPNQKLKIMRAGLMVGVGQVFDRATGLKTILPMAWESVKVHDHAPRLFRDEFKRFPLVAEFGRAVAEKKGPLPGNLRIPVLALVGTLQEEARILGVPPDQYMVFGAALDRFHAAYFGRSYGMKPWMPRLSYLLQDEGIDVGKIFANFRNVDPVPENPVYMAPLSRAIEKVRLPSLSYRDNTLVEITKGRMNHQRAREFQYEILKNIWSYIYLPEYPEQGPLCLWDQTDYPAAQMALSAREVSEGDDRVANRLLQFFSDEHYTDMNLFMPYWHEKGFIGQVNFGEDAPLTVQGPITHAKLPFGMGPRSVRLDNLSEEVFQKYGHRFLLAALFSVYHYYDQRIETIHPLVHMNLHEAMIQSGAQGLGPFISAKDFFNHYPVNIATSSQRIARELQTLGGITEISRVAGIPPVRLTREQVGETLALQVDDIQVAMRLMEDKITIGRVQDIAYEIRFSGEQILKLKEEYRDIPYQINCAEYFVRAGLMDRAAHF